MEQVVNYEIEASVDSYETQSKLINGRIRVQYAPVWYFNYLGKEYRIFELFYNVEKKYRVGDSKTIHINPNNPTEAVIEDSWILSTPYLGIILAIAGACSTYYFL